MKVIPKTKDQIILMRKAGKIWADGIAYLKKHISPGITLLQLDALAEDYIRSQGAVPAFKGFQGFPGTLCTMLNSEVVHGIPDDRAVQKGDLLTIDGGCIYQGWFSDAAFSLVVGGDETHPERARFEKSVKKALERGCAQAKHGNRLGDIGYAVQESIEKDGYSVCQEYTGHGIGREMWELPHVYNYGQPHTGLKLEEGMTLCIEPIIARGRPETKTLKDGWTVVTVDGKDACQWEHCGMVTRNGLEIFV